MTVNAQLKAARLVFENNDPDHAELNVPVAVNQAEDLEILWACDGYTLQN